MKNGLKPHAGQVWWDNFSLIPSKWGLAYAPEAYEVWSVTVSVANPDDVVVELKDSTTGVITQMPRQHLWDNYTPKERP